MLARIRSDRLALSLPGTGDEMLLTARQRRRRNASIKWGVPALLVALLLAPKLDGAIVVPDLSFPLVTTAVAAE